MVFSVILSAAAASFGSLILGWHEGATAGALLYLKQDINIEENEMVEGLIVSIAILGAFISTIFSGPLADFIGRKIVLNISAILYCMGSAVMAWSPNAIVLVIGRFITGAAFGFATSVIPLYLSECSPTEIRGTLLTFPQLFQCLGMFLSFSNAFGMSLTRNPNWRLMLGITLVPAIIYVALCTWYIQESPRWLVSKGKMLEAKKVLDQMLRKTDDIGAELALLVEGLDLCGDETFEEYILRPSDSTSISSTEQEWQLEIIRPDDEGQSWKAMSITNVNDDDGNNLIQKTASHRDFHSLLAPDPVVKLVNSLQATPSTDLELLQSFMGLKEPLSIDLENQQYQSPIQTGYEAVIDPFMGQFEEDITKPLLQRDMFVDDQYDTSSPKAKTKHSNVFDSSVSPQSTTTNLPKVQSGVNDSTTEVMEDTMSENICGGWALAWQWSEDDSEMKRVFLRQDGIMGSKNISASSLPRLSSVSSHNLVMQASALVGRSSKSLKDLLDEGDLAGPATAHPLSKAVLGPAWFDILEPGVKQALFIGCMLQFLQQFSGLTAALYYTPQIILASSGGSLLSSTNENSVSLLASAVTSLTMIPFTLWAVKLMDVSGRRKILLQTLPLLVICLITQIIISLSLPAGVMKAVVSFLIMLSFLSCFVMGFGPVPSILCAEIFPTRVRGLCNGICTGVMWFFTIVVTYCFPIALSKLHMNGVFGVFAVVCIVSLLFVYKKVPETKGMPLEMISELFAKIGNIKEEQKTSEAEK